jgi:hypothetical protein
MSEHEMDPQSGRSEWGHTSVLPADRRDVPARKALLRRVRGEFEEVPGLALTLAQAGRLFHLPPDTCSRVFTELVDAGFLRLTPRGTYVNRGDVPYDRARK